MMDDMAYEMFNKALDWELTAESANDTECRFFCTDNELEEFLSFEDTQAFNFTAREMNCDGATITISKVPGKESPLSLDALMKKFVQHFTGLLMWDNEGYGNRVPYVCLRRSEFDESYVNSDDDVVKFEVYGMPHVLHKDEKEATVHIAFEIR